MANVINQGFTIEFDDIAEDLRVVKNTFDTQGPLPVRANTTIDNFSFTINEFMPMALDPLSDGVLEGGSMAYIQLPQGWSLINPLQIQSNTLDLNICGNDPGSNTVLIEVLNESLPGSPDEIEVIVTGIQVGPNTGVAEGSLTVFPGRSTSFKFMVLPEDCTSIPFPSADIDGSGKVDLGDISIVSSQFLLEFY